MDGSNNMRPQSLHNPDKAPTLPNGLPMIFHGLVSPETLVNNSSHQPPPRGGVQGGLVYQCGSLLHSQAPLDVNAGMDISHAQSPRPATAPPINEGTLVTNAVKEKRKARHPLHWLHHRPKTQTLNGKAKIDIIDVERIERPQQEEEEKEEPALVNPTTAPVDQEEPPASTPTVERHPLLHNDGITIQQHHGRLNMHRVMVRTPLMFSKSGKRFEQVRRLHHLATQNSFMNKKRKDHHTV